MTASQNTNRSAVTLIEVLVAIFVMGIGLICLLTLFPLGAMRMAAAFKNELAAQAAVNARTIAAAKNLRNDPAVLPKYKNPDTAHQDADDFGPSYPVFVDPIGAVQGAMLGSNIARIGPSYAPDSSAMYQGYFGLLDDVTFQRGFGVPKQFGPRIERETLYTWAYLLQRPRMGDAAVTNASVCVFQRRPKAGSLDKEYGATMNPLDNTITISYVGSAPNIQPGMWVLDGTLNPANKKYAFGNFYRITGVRDVSATQLALDLQTPLQGYNGVAAAGQVVILDGLVEVFDLGPGR